MKNNLANIITGMSLFTGWIAITLLINVSIKMAIVVSVVSFILDMADGYVARKWGRVTPFGRHFDSMSDFLNYSVFSAFLLSRYMIPTVFGHAIAASIVVLGAYRLVKFSAQGYLVIKEKKYYRGLVTPLVSYTIMMLYIFQVHNDFPQSIIGIFAFIVSVLQVAPISIRKTTMNIWWLMLAGLLVICTILFL